MHRLKINMEPPKCRFWKVIFLFNSGWCSGFPAISFPECKPGHRQEIPSWWCLRCCFFPHCSSPCSSPSPNQGIVCLRHASMSGESKEMCRLNQGNLTKRYTQQKPYFTTFVGIYIIYVTSYGWMLLFSSRHLFVILTLTLGQSWVEGKSSHVICEGLLWNAVWFHMSHK